MPPSLLRAAVEAHGRGGLPVAAWILTYGREETATTRPPEIPLGAASRCFHNASAIAFAHPHLRYCEGFALPDDVHAPTYHAWVSDGRHAIELTWGTDGTRYFGVALPTATLARLRARHGIGSVLWIHAASTPPTPWWLAQAPVRRPQAAGGR